MNANANERSVRLGGILSILAVCVFLFGLARTTDSLYLKTLYHQVLEPERIMAGTSQAPNQYRVLPAFLITLLNEVLLHDLKRSDHAVVFCSILMAYVESGALFWISSRLHTLLSITNPANVLYIGAGVIFAYLATVACGNREYIPFILGYAVPLLFVSAFISSFSEHRVFYPLMVMLVAAMVRYADREDYRKLRDEGLRGV